MESKILTGNDYLCPAKTFKFYPVGKRNQQVLVTGGWCLHILYYHPYSTSLTCYSFKIRQPLLQKPINYLRHKKCTECNRIMTSACPSQLKKKKFQQFPLLSLSSDINCLLNLVFINPSFISPIFLLHIMYTNIITWKYSSYLAFLNITSVILILQMYPLSLIYRVLLCWYNVLYFPPINMYLVYFQLDHYKCCHYAHPHTCFFAYIWERGIEMKSPGHSVCMFTTLLNIVNCHLKCANF